ncbi:MFS general substrate transporter [Phanerochaete sordida]|uniref:MFS general substrate transporter n=1 Tax=Phanerochaete sordida TaxID=48140 RepID=A0A9P3GEG2_9APHY|nr:MFS general substrate transporter [Phanerochaete sordida]
MPQTSRGPSRFTPLCSLVAALGDAEVATDWLERGRDGVQGTGAIPQRSIGAFNPAADLAESEAPRTTAARKDEESKDPYEVVLDPADDPKNMNSFRKWVILLVICSGALCATCASSMASFTETGISEDFHVGHEVSILGISLYVLGLGLGPLLIGPLSEVHGRNAIYRVSYLIFFAFSWAVAFPPDIAVYLIFRFLTGFSSSAFLSVAGGSVSDLFENDKVATPMAVYTVSPFIGPAAGPLISGFINQNANWRWTYRTLVIWIFVELAFIVLLVPETYVPAILKRKAQILRKTTGDNRYWAPLEKRERSLLHSVAMSCYVPFKLMALESMALLLNLWAALILGIQYLTFQAFPIIFEDGHHFNVQSTGMSFIGMGLGLLLGLACQPIINIFLRKQKIKYNGNPPPEIRLVIGMWGAVLIPISLFWLAFTTYPHVHWIVPIIASVPFGIGILFCFSTIFTYLVTAYRPIAASAMSSNTFVRTSFAAAFPLFAGQMYHRLGTVGATALLAGLTTLAAPIPFVFYKIGARLRARSRFTGA